MSVNLSPVGGVAQQFFDNNGQPLSGGKIYTYASGTTTPQTVYTSSAAGTPHSNPIILDSAGRVPGGGGAGRPTGAAAGCHRGPGDGTDPPSCAEPAASDQ
jgi:hypothetical protein